MSSNKFESEILDLYQQAKDSNYKRINLSPISRDRLAVK